MEPFELVMWAMFLGVAWLVFASITGADEWLKPRAGVGKIGELEERVAVLEYRLEQLEKQNAGQSKNS